MLETILNLIAPVSCQVCGVKGMLCCATHFVETPPTALHVGELSGLYARELDADLLKLLSAFKDRSITALAKDLAQIAKPLTESEIWQSSEIVLIPPTTKRAYRKRGFVPARLILQRLKLSTQIRSLSLTRQTLDQRSLDFRARAENLAGAYRADGLSGKTVVLFDDVITTSATLGEMIRAAEISGAKVSGFCVLARRFPNFDPADQKQA